MNIHEGSYVKEGRKEGERQTPNKACPYEAIALLIGIKWKRIRHGIRGHIMDLAKGSGSEEGRGRRKIHGSWSMQGPYKVLSSEESSGKGYKKPSASYWNKVPQHYIFYNHI